jgi:hypothetical protein
MNTGRGWYPKHHSLVRFPPDRMLGMSAERPTYGIDWWLVIRVLIYFGMFALLLNLLYPTVQ